MKLLTLLALILAVSVAFAGAEKPKKLKGDDGPRNVAKTAQKPANSLDAEGSGDYDDDEYDYDDDDLDVSSGSSAAKKKVAKADDDDSLEKIVDDIREKEVEEDDDDEEDADDGLSTTTTSTPAAKDDIHFVEEDSNSAPIETDKPKPRKPASGSKKDDLLYEYYTEYLDEDYDDLTDVDDAEKKPPVVVSTARPADVVESVDKESIPADKSSVFPPSYIFIILASALVSFTVFMLAFLVCRRTVAARRQKKLMPFVVSSSAFGPPSAAVKSSGSIVKSYQRVPTSTKEFLQQQQQHLGSEKKEPLLT